MKKRAPLHANPKKLDPLRNYVVELCQTLDGYRYTNYRITNDTPDPQMIFESNAGPGQALIDWGYYDHSAHLSLTNGQKYGYEAHGIWMTKAEMEWEENESKSLPPWVNGLAPQLPPK